MTIPQPNRSHQAMLAIKILLGGIFSVSILSVFLYNSMVNVRSEARAQAEAAQSLRVENAELKNEYFAKIDSRNLIDVAQRLGYVKEPSPGYLSLDSGVSEEAFNAPGSLTIHTSVYVQP